LLFFFIFFFFQAEDGIRDGHVTGVQTCALPILFLFFFFSLAFCADAASSAFIFISIIQNVRAIIITIITKQFGCWAPQRNTAPRSEERRVGKEYRSKSAKDQ